MFGVFKIDQVAPFEPEDPDPLELRFEARVIVFLYTGIDTSSAADAPGKVKAVTPEGIRKGFLCADLEFLPEFLQVPFFQSGDDPFFFLGGHFTILLLQEIFGLLLCATGQERQGDTP